ncbi:helix-turn-helix domain-containing protein [Erythrobacter sp. F6033]|uniref:helix-turn-helix domain-containing protein n=1 Tax=Erythrobacter sp. F6033 TaxID=2926401 RepID=UPI001FF6DA1B|nr:helix-turn-helix domain-containing protein [Erythrobacter sp. F6033]MCK0127052.1 helix-turn-helix domain-containing protein [Erythrobacter sp. F6033]
MATSKRDVGGSSTDYTVRSNFHSPPKQFDGCFTTFYHLSLNVGDGGSVHDYLQPEWGNIRFFCGGRPTAKIGSSMVSGASFNATGPSSLPAEFELGTSEMWGIGFLPVGWARFVEADAHELANTVHDGTQHPAFAKYAPLESALCDPDVTREEQFDAIVELMGRLMRPNRDEPKIVRVHQALVDGEFLAVSDLADACGMSIRTLERVCRRYFGFTPKKLMRRQRFTRSLTSFMLHQGSRWTEAMDGEYHDQAQFTREFREFMTMNPSEYAALDHPILSSFMEARARVWGSAAQALDKPSR